MRYGGLSYAAKFDNILHQRRRSRRLGEKMEKLIEVNMGLQ